MVPHSQHERDNVVHWTLWALFASETMRPEWKEEVDGYVRGRNYSREEVGGGI